MMMMAKKKVGGSSRNGRDSIGRRLGIKLNHMQEVRNGGVIVRQRGKKYLLGENTYYGKDHTIHSHKNGRVTYITKRNRVYVHVVQSSEN